LKLLSLSPFPPAPSRWLPVPPGRFPGARGPVPADRGRPLSFPLQSRLPFQNLPIFRQISSHASSWPAPSRSPAGGGPAGGVHRKRLSSLLQFLRFCPLDQIFGQGGFRGFCLIQSASSWPAQSLIMGNENQIKPLLKPIFSNATNHAFICGV